MTVRTATDARTPSAVPQYWQRRNNALTAVPTPRMPEPVQLYALITLYLATHTPDALERCIRCDRVWPCGSVRLAYRLREGF